MRTRIRCKQGASSSLTGLASLEPAMQPAAHSFPLSSCRSRPTGGGRKSDTKREKEGSIAFGTCLKREKDRRSGQPTSICLYRISGSTRIVYICVIVVADFFIFFSVYDRILFMLRSPSHGKFVPALVTGEVGQKTVSVRPPTDQ